MCLCARCCVGAMSILHRSHEARIAASAASSYLSIFKRALKKVVSPSAYSLPRGPKVGAWRFLATGTSFKGGACNATRRAPRWHYPCTRDARASAVELDEVSDGLESISLTVTSWFSDRMCVDEYRSSSVGAETVRAPRSARRSASARSKVASRAALLAHVGRRRRVIQSSPCYQACSRSRYFLSAAGCRNRQRGFRP